MKHIIYLLTIVMFAACSVSEDNRSGALSKDSNSPFLGNVLGDGGSSGEAGPDYNGIVENPFINTSDETLSTFSIDADGAAYSNTRRYLTSGQLPPVDAIRTEEIINYFNYSYQDPTGPHPISLEGEISTCPWEAEHKLMRIGIKGEQVYPIYYPPSNIVFLIDVSGSMGGEGKLELLKEGFKLFVDQIRPVDRIAIATYASNPGVLLESTAGTDANKAFIKSQIDKLGASGSTNGEGGILAAYEIANEHFVEGGNNRIIVGTDGDFNVGISNQEDLVALIEEQRESGVFLTVLGVGQNTYNEGTMEQLANNGNGNYEYLDNLDQLQKVFVNEYNKFFTVAKDVKIQVDFNPQVVSAYRLIGYENRLLQSEDFEDDNQDAGEIGGGQSITALYELVVNSAQQELVPAVNVDFRYKAPESSSSELISLSITDDGNSFNQSSRAHQFSAAAAAFGLVLRDSEYKGDATYEDVYNWAESSGEEDYFGYKAEFLELVKLAKGL